MKATVTVATIENGAQFCVTRVDSKNNAKSEVIHSRTMLDHKTTARLVNGAQKGMESLQDAWQSMLGEVFSNPKLDGYRGEGDKSTGKTSKEFKASIRKCEDDYFAILRDEKLLTIPKGDNMEKEFESVCTKIREDKNYSNIKSTVSKYFAFVGANCVTQSGHLVPKAVMIEHINAVLDVTPEDASVYGQLLRIKGELEKVTLDEVTTRKAEPLAREIASVLKGLIAHYDELVSNAAQGLPVNAGLPAAMTKIRGKMMRAPAPVNDIVHEDALV